MLTSFTLPQLQAQLAGLQALVKDSQGHLEQVRKAERLQRAQVQKLTHAKRKADASSDLHGQDEHNESGNPSTHSGTAAPVEKDASEKEHKECVSEELSAGAQLGKQRRRTLRKQIERLEARIKALKIEQNGAEISAQDAEKGAEGLSGEAVDTQYNPKTRGGWGFWKT